MTTDDPANRPFLDPPGWARDLGDCMRFLTRIPLRPANGEMAPISHTMRAFPLVGALLGAAGGLVFALCAALGLPSPICAIATVAALIALTGAFHEDGLADTADGFGGGWRREDKLAIMHDSRLGTYGAAALFLDLAARIAAIAAIGGAAGAAGALAALIGTGAWSRSLIVVFLSRTPPARDRGQSHSAGNPDATTVRHAVVAGGAIAAIAVLAVFGVWSALVAFAASLGALVLVRRLCLTQIGGHTGDTAGTVQQASEIAMLLALVAMLNAG